MAFGVFRARRQIVRKHTGRTTKHIVFKLDAFIHANVVLNLTAITDTNIVCNIYVLAKTAILANCRPGLNVAKVPYLGAVTNLRILIDNGRLICQIGIAPVKPAEFVIFRITQKTASE